MTDRLAEIFDHKRVSSAEFRAVQRKHGLILCPEDMRADPATREGAQELHKGIHWINLEYSEAICARREDRPEELADVLHFLVELALLLGYDHTVVPESLVEDEDRLAFLLRASEADPLVFPDFETNARFGILANLVLADLIKNKPWKQTLRPPPAEKAQLEAVQGMFYWYGATVRTAGISAAEIFQAFVGKDAVNHNRVVTGV